MKMADRIFQNVPEGYNGAVEKIRLIPQDIFAEICQDVAGFLQYTVPMIPTKQHQKKLQEAGVDCDAKLISNVVSYIFRSAAKAKSTANQLVEELSATMIWDEPSLAVVRHTWNEHGKVLCSPDLLQILNIGQLIDMKWKLSVGMGSSFCKNLNAPYVTMMVTVSDSSGNPVTNSFEMTLGEFKKFANQMKEMASMIETV